MNETDFSSFSITADTSLYDVIKCIDKSAKLSIALVINEKKQLIATITDGDIRRAILAGFNLENKIQDILPMKEKGPHPLPVVAPSGIDQDELLELMQERKVRQIPLVNERGEVEDIVLLSDLIQQQELPIQALIMAGGMGQRLRPLTAETPKPMLSVGPKPLLEHIVKQLRNVGITKINISTYYKPEIITNYFGDGSAFGVQINYFYEDRPLGTGGVLGLMHPPEVPLLVMNGDILTRANFRSMLTRHEQSNATMTMAVRLYGVQVPYGVVTTEGEIIQDLLEKPHYDFLINAGIYLISPSVFRYIPRGEFFNITDLIHWLLKAGEKVISFPIVEYWLDIGKRTDYDQAQTDFQEGLFGHELE